MNRIEEIRVLLLSLILEVDKWYVEELLNELQLKEKQFGYSMHNKLCSKIANLIFNKQEREFPSNVLDYIAFISYGDDNPNGWKPNDEVHKKMLEYYESEIKGKIDG